MKKNVNRIEKVELTEEKKVKLDKYFTEMNSILTYEIIKDCVLKKQFKMYQVGNGPIFFEIFYEGEEYKVCKYDDEYGLQTMFLSVECTSKLQSDYFVDQDILNYHGKISNLGILILSYICLDFDL